MNVILFNFSFKKVEKIKLQSKTKRMLLRKCQLSTSSSPHHTLSCFIRIPLLYVISYNLTNYWAEKEVFCINDWLNITFHSEYQKRSETAVLQSTGAVNIHRHMCINKPCWKSGGTEAGNISISEAQMALYCTCIIVLFNIIGNT